MVRVLVHSLQAMLRLCFYFLLVQLSVFVVGFPAMLQLDCYISELFQCSSSVQRRRRHFWQGLFTVMNTSEWSSPPPNYNADIVALCISEIKIVTFFTFPWPQNKQTNRFFLSTNYQKWLI